MALSIPSRVKPGKDSFPTTPEAVRDWLADIQPIRSIESARLLYRGIKHGNRLESSTRNRLEVAEILEPAVIETLNSLEEHFFGHPIPLQRKEKNARRLHESILLEIAHSWKLVVNETYATLLPGQAKARSVGIFKSIVTLARHIEVYLNLHESVPKQVLEDLNTLYQFALKSHLSDKPLSDGSRDFRGEWSIDDAYAYAITLTLINGHIQRRSQIPGLCQFLAENIDSVSIGDFSPVCTSGTFGLFLEHGGKPLPSQYTGENTGAEKIHIDVTRLLSRIDLCIEQNTENSSNYPDANSIDRVALLGLKQSFVNGRKRSASRAITNRKVHTRVGLMEVGIASTVPQPPELAAPSKVQTKKSVHWPVDAPDTGGWTMVNNSPSGACLRWRGRGTTAVEVGEIISFNPDPADEDYSWKTAVVRWIRVPGEDQLMIGVETISGDISVVRLTRSNTEPQRHEILTPRLCLLVNDSDAEPDEATDTLVAPAGVFMPGDTVETDDLRVFQLMSNVDSTAAIDRFTFTEDPSTDTSNPATDSKDQFGSLEK